jgi:RNA polymerase sigma-70 factor (ECF subfamily)
MAERDSLVVRCQQGDLLAFSELFDRHEGGVYRLTLAILGNEKDAEDAVQDTFLKLFERLHDYRHDSAFTTWLTAVAVNVCRDRLRRLKVRRALSLEWLPGLSSGENVDEVVSERFRRDTLWSAVERLEEKYRLPVILHYRQGLSCEEVATVLNLPVSRVYSRLNAARIRLRAALHSPARPAAVPQVGQL